MTGNADSELESHAILVTGATQGVGRAIALACASSGATVIACGRNVPALENLADEVCEKGHPEPVLLPINLERATVDDYNNVAGLVREQFGHLDGLVLNAGVLGDLAPLAHYDAVTWARVFQVNVHSTFLLLQACHELLTDSPDSSVIFTLAAEGIAAKPNWGAYAVSKYATRGLMELAAGEFSGTPGTRVNGGVPGPVNTALRRAAFPASNPAGWPLPASVVATYLTLLGPRGKHLHGAILDGENGEPLI